MCLPLACCPGTVPVHCLACDNHMQMRVRMRQWTTTELTGMSLSFPLRTIHCCYVRCIMTALNLCHLTPRWSCAAASAVADVCTGQFAASPTIEPLRDEFFEFASAFAEVRTRASGPALSRPCSFPTLGLHSLRQQSLHDQYRRVRMR